MNPLYTKIVMEHFQNPQNAGEMKDPDGVGNVGNRICGDIVRLYLKISNGKIQDAKFKTFGCGAAIASSSMVTVLVKGKTVEQASKITNKDVAEALGGLPPIKMHCSVLAEDVIREALNDYFKKQGKPLLSKRPDAHG